jgi:predicted ATPase
MGVLSFDQFGLGLSERVTFIVGPNGAGKSNLTRLLGICLRAIESGDGAAGDVDRLLAAFLAARHVGSQSPSVEARVAVRLTDAAERELVTEFVRAMVTGAMTARRQVENMAEIDAWAEAEITEDKLRPLLEGEIVTSHPGTQDGRWQCAFEFTAPGHDQAEHRYRWILLGLQPGSILDADTPVTAQGGSDVATRVTGSSTPPSGPSIPVPGSFQLLDLLPKPDLPTWNCTFDLSGTPSGSQRRFAEMTGLTLNSPGGSRTVSLATVLRVLFRRALVQTSDTRLLPSGGISWSSSELALTGGAESRLPELLARLKNGDPAARARYQRIRELFTEFTQGRGCEVRLLQVQQPAQDGQAGTTAQVPAIWVTVNASDGSAGLDPEVPIEFAGAGAWEALVLASVLGEPSASVVVLDEPAVALHPSLQRQLGAHLLSAPAQFLVITHSAELLPLGGATGIKLVRLDRDDKNATRAWPVDDACRVKMARKLAAKGNERLPFAWRAILCEGQDDVEAIMALAERMGIDLRRRNIAVADCGSRDNLPDYIWFCAELGLKYLTVMDADSSKPDALPKAQAVRDAVSLRHGGELAEFPENLEATFGVPKQRPSLVPGAIKALPFTGYMPDPAQAPPEVVALAEALQRLTK